MTAPTPNPYAPPTAVVSTTGLECPQCKSRDTYRPAFTMWGGALGPKLFKHVICRNCKFGFNAVTGKSNHEAIWMYRGVSFGLAGVFAIIYVILNSSK